MRKIRLRFWLIFCQTPVKNRVTMATTYAPGDQKVYQMMCHRLTIKVTKFQQSSANHFLVVAKTCLGQIPPPPPPLQYKLGFKKMGKMSNVNPTHGVSGTH